jgi:hypothetical protein
LSAKEGSKTLGEEEFLIANFLVHACKQGQPLPKVVPDELIKSIKSGTASLGSGSKPSSKKLTGASSSSPDDSPTSKIRTGRSSKTGESPDRKKSATMRTNGGPSGREDGSAPRKVKSKWALSKDEKRRFLETFATCNTDGFVDGPVAVQLFTTSGLPREELASIWALSDMDRDRKLSQQEFCIAMHLISRRMLGDQLPDTVPTQLVLSSASSEMGKKHSKGLSRAGQSSGLQRTTSERQPDTASSTRNPRHSIMGPVMLSGGFEPSSGMARSVSTIDGSIRTSGGFSAFGDDMSLNSGTRQPLAARSFTSTPMSSGSPVGIGGGVGSFSSSEIPPFSGSDSLSSLSGGFGSQSHGSLSNRGSPTVQTLASYGIDDKIIPEYDASTDLMRLEEITDLPTVKQLMAQLSEEVKSLSGAFDKSQLQAESIRDRLASRLDQNSSSLRRKATFETILLNYNQQLDTDIGLYDNLKAELQDISADIDSQQQQLSSPQYDVSHLREKKRALQSEYNQIRTAAAAGRDEHTRLVLEVEKLRAAGAEQASNIDIQWSDHGFKEEPAVAFGESDFASSASSTSLATTSTNASFAPTFQFNPKTAFGSASGTMTPSMMMDEFDSYSFGGDDRSEVAEEVDLAWIKPDFAAAAATATPGANADFFATESANWASFSEQHDERTRARASSISGPPKGSEKKPSSRKIKDKENSTKEKKKKKH